MGSEHLPQDLIEQMMAGLETSLPPIFSRKTIPKFLGNCIAAGTLANLGLKNSPPYLRRGRHAIYEKTSFLRWLKKWLNGENSHE